MHEIQNAEPQRHATEAIETAPEILPPLHMLGLVSWRHDNVLSKVAVVAAQYYIGQGSPPSRSIVDVQV